MEQKDIWADGGLSHSAPRDTLVAYWGALGAGADGIIVGAQLTSDGVVICCATDSVEATTGEAGLISEMTAEDVRKLDAGAMFRSMLLDDNNQETDAVGEDTPWIRNNPRDALYHPTLDEVLRILGRRTRFMVTLGSGEAAASEELVAATIGVLDRFALTSKSILAGNAATLELVGDRAGRCLLPAAGAAAGDAAQEAENIGAQMVMVSAADAAGGDLGGAPLLVAPTAGHRAPSPAEYARLADAAGVIGYAASALLELGELSHPRGLVAKDDFEGNDINEDLWVLGHSRPNEDTKVWVDDGLHIQVKGEEYSGGAAFTTYSIHGAFDARMTYRVENPHQGTTFELAAVHVDAGYRPRNLTFDVHGAPPYASSERDEDDGFRLGWNNGPALTKFVPSDEQNPDPFHTDPQSSNLYNNYSRDIGYAKKDSPEGQLRLTRHGYVFNGYYRDQRNAAWVLSGSEAVPALAEAVFLRLGGKHWPKRGNPAPNNKFKFTGFELRQW